MAVVALLWLQTCLWTRLRSRTEHPWCLSSWAVDSSVSLPGVAPFALLWPCPHTYSSCASSSRGYIDLKQKMKNHCCAASVGHCKNLKKGTGSFPQKEWRILCQGLLICCLSPAINHYSVCLLLLSAPVWVEVDENCNITNKSKAVVSAQWRWWWQSYHNLFPLQTLHEV